MEQREFYRRIRYELSIGETLDYENITVTRHRTAVAVASRASRETIRATNYSAAIPDILAAVERQLQTEAGAEPANVQCDTGATPDYHGVRRDWRSNINPWSAQCYIGQSRPKYLGLHPTAEAAARAYDAYVIANGLDKPLNFPEHAKAAS